MTIDWGTLALQTVNVLILIWLLGRFFWRPVAAMIEERRAKAQGLLDEAQAQRDKASAALAEVERRKAGFAREREAMLRQAQAEAEQARENLLRQAKAETDVLRANASAEMEKAKAEAERAWTDKAGDLAMSIAEKLASRLDGADIRAAFLRWLIVQIEALPEATRQSVGARAAPLEAVTASTLAPDEAARVRAAIAAAFGHEVDIRLSVDPALIAGLELRAPHFILSNSWRADLAKIRQNSLRGAP